MTWRNQDRDLAILFSLSDDLKLFWQLKANRWEKLEGRVRLAAEQVSGYGQADEEEVSIKFKKMLLGDPEYKELRHRIRTASKEVLKMALFLGLPHPAELDELTFKPPLMTYEAIEAAVQAIDNFISLCRVSYYPYHYIVQAIKSPRQFATDLWDFYHGK